MASRLASEATEKSKAKTGNAARQKKIIASRERLLKIKRTVLALVEAMLEKNISKEWFLQNVIKLCHADYDDVVEERSIEHLCGYPLCSNPIKKVIQQKYHISRVTNKVYDLTERKNFCGNICFKASQYLKAQLSPIPLYMRKEERIEVHLLPDGDNKGSEGEEILFHHKVPQEELDKVWTVEKASFNLKNMLNDEIKNCTDSLSGLKITEHVFDHEKYFKNLDKEVVSDQEQESSEKSDIESDDSIDKKLFPAHENLSVLSETHMPVPKRTVKTQVIPLINTQNVGIMSEKGNKEVSS